MQIQNLSFFDKFGKNLNLLFDPSKNLWTGKIYFNPLSIYLFDNENLFIFEKIGNDYKFPALSPGQKLRFSWKDNLNENELFLYDVKKDIELNNLFINKIKELYVSYDDILPTSDGSNLDINLPLQVNIAFNPSGEKAFERTLYLFLIDESSPRIPTKVAEIYFYGEGEDEEERFKVWTANFGIKFNREDANILKEYDIKEALPDWEQVNLARKDLLVNKDQIFPYVGTYKCLSNFINLLGYRDVLAIKEYWKNVNPKSSYFNKLFLVDISDYLDDGIIETLDLTDKNKNLKNGLQFKKTELLALVYQFTRESGDFDEDGIPIIEETTEFTVNEIFYKLNRLHEKLKQDFLPINVKIKDIIGEFVYFQRITLFYWKDQTKITEYRLNDRVDITSYPGINVDVTLRSLDPLFRQKDPKGIDYGVVRFNQDAPNPFEYSQYYTRDQIVKIIPYIEKFYDEIKMQRYPNLNQRLSWEFGDDPERVIGAPIIFRINPEKFTFETFRGVSWNEVAAVSANASPYWTLQNLDFKNVYEIVWKISKPAPNPYSFEYRGKAIDIFELPHFLPYAGKYLVTVELWDFYGNVTPLKIYVTVQDDKKPQILGITRLEDKFDYEISNLSNVQLKDFGASPFYYPKVNVLNNEDLAVKVDVYKNLLEWISFYKHRYGMGQSLYDIEIYDPETATYVPYTDPTQKHPKKLYWGLGEGQQPIRIKDLPEVEIGSLYFMRFCDLVYLDDFNAGFYFENPVPGEVIKISTFSDYIIPKFNNLTELVKILNESDHPGIRLFNYEIISGKIHAQAEYLSKEMYHFLHFYGNISPVSPSNGQGDKYTFFLPKQVYSDRLINFFKSISPVFDTETLFLFAKTSDILSGAVQDPYFWEDTKYWKIADDVQKGYLPTVIDQNAFNINDIKVFEESFAVPENAIVFFVVNNLDGKNEFIWTLTNSLTGEEVIRVKSVPFFAWKFKDLGRFTLKVEVFDNRGTSYTNEVQNFITVLQKREYVSGVEFNLNQRKNKLLKG